MSTDPIVSPLLMISEVAASAEAPSVVSAHRVVSPPSTSCTEDDSASSSP